MPIPVDNCFFVHCETHKITFFQLFFVAVLGRELCKRVWRLDAGAHGVILR